MRRWLWRIVAALVALFALVYVADWTLLQVRERNGSAHGSVVVENADVIKEKGGKVEYFFNPPQPTSCVHSLFSHEGQPACWWLTRHSDQQKFMN
jgi:hypothetical protein